MSQRQQEIEEVDAELATLESEHKATEALLRQIEARRTTASLRKRLLETLLRIETSPDLEQDQVTELLDGLVDRAVRMPPVAIGDDEVARKFERPSETAGRTIVNRKLLNSVINNIKENRQRACQMVIETLERLHPAGASTEELDLPILNTGVVSESVLSKCKSLLRKEGFIEHDRKAKVWSIGLPDDRGHATSN